MSTEDFKDLMTITLKTFNKERRLPAEKYNGVSFMLELMTYLKSEEIELKMRKLTS